MLTGAVILAGGAATRLGGVDKPMVEVGGTSLLSVAVRAAHEAGATDVVVVGPVRNGIDGVRWVVEDPPGSGPGLAIAAGLAALADRNLVAVLAADLPFLTADDLVVLARQASAVAVDDVGRAQWLLGVHRDLDPSGARASARAVLDRPGLTLVALPTLSVLDCDAPADLAAARRLADG